MNIEFGSIDVGLQILNDVVKSLYESLNKLKGLSAIIPKGRYQGRHGKIQAVSIEVQEGYFPEIIVLIHPYNLKKKDGSIIYDDIDARRYWRFKEFKDTITDKAVWL